MHRQGASRLTLTPDSFQGTSGARHRTTLQEVLRSPRDDIANELVNWFNDVDATYQASLKELNEASMVMWLVGVWLTTVLGFAGTGIALLRLR